MLLSSCWEIATALSERMHCFEVLRAFFFALCSIELSLNLFEFYSNWTLLNGYWTKITKADETSKFYSEAATVMMEWIFHIFEQLAVFLMEYQRAAVSCERELWRQICRGSRVPVLLFLFSTSFSFHSHSSAKAPMFCLRIVRNWCCSYRFWKPGGDERVERRKRRLALLACPFRVGSTSRDVTSFCSRGGC